MDTMTTDTAYEEKIAEFPKECPRCHNFIKAFRFSALCRRDNMTDICSACGELEGWEDARMAFPYEGEVYWDPNGIGR